ncbi:LAMI_0G01090g1_1 [Lachancea mirantina]|uniref:LAMI_0G01090g1_1 n=1 Tax=Lachancea mirantina TaxID=1230905 RepID=A0A1G4K7D3_9SACH|nr:LAMI_0G01090g1_1 [Lachancea mirantina]
MSTYEEEHNTSANNASRNTIRDHFREAFQEGGDSGNLLELLSQMMPQALQEELLNGPEKGCPEYYIESLPRVPKEKLKPEESCSICCCNYRDDNYPLVVFLPHCSHRFDFECLAVWLSKSTTCPLCRDDVIAHRQEIDITQVELEEDWGMYG